MQVVVNHSFTAGFTSYGKSFMRLNLDSFILPDAMVYFIVRVVPFLLRMVMNETPGS